MCLPECTIQLAEARSRRALLRTALGSVAACAAAPVVTRAAEPPKPRAFSRVVDLTHVLTPDFPTGFPKPLEMERVATLAKDRWNFYRWHLIEHVGTHLDAPFHCSDGDTADRIPTEKLVGPLAIIDIRDRATADADTRLTPADLRAWEAKNGRLPEGCIVAMNSGWDARVGDRKKFLGLDEQGKYHLPGFHVEATQFLYEERNVVGIGVDTLNLDPGLAGDFPVHHYWLGKNKWGLENLANLGQLPAVGATIVVGSPKIAGCSGGPSRVMALV
jgi:kynurenine formamidase